MIKVNRKELLEKLNKLKLGLPRANIVQDDYCFLFYEGRIYTYNDDVCISTKFEIEKDFAVRADEFLSAIQKGTSDTITLKIDEKVLVIKAGKYNAEVACTDSNNLQERVLSLGMSKGRKWKKIPDGLLEGLKLCVFSVGSDMTNVIFTYINVNRDKVISSDEFRVSEYTMKEEIEDNLLLKGSVVVDLLKFNVNKYFDDKGGTYFKNNDYTFWIRKDELGREFPDFSKDFKFKGDNLEFPDNIKDMVSFCSIFSQEDFDLRRKIEVRVENGKMTAKGETSGVGKGEVSAAIDYDKPEPISFEIHPGLFTEILSKTKRGKIGSDRILFRMKNFKHLLGLVEE